MHVVTQREFEQILRASGREGGEKRPFSFRGMTFYPGMAGLYQVTAAELVPAESYRGRVFDDPFGSFSKPGFLKKIGGRRFVFAGFHHFVLEGTHLAVSAHEASAPAGQESFGSQVSLFAE